MYEIAPHDAPMIATLLAIVIPLVCFVAVLLLLRLSVKASWLTAIAASVVVAGIPFIMGIRMLPGRPRIMVGWLFLLPAAVCVVILVVQFMRWLLAASDSATVNTAERSRILKMVEEGKMSADEGRELLDAMGRSSALRGQNTFSRLDIAMLCGVALVILGFFLPWAYITLPNAARTFDNTSIFKQVSAYQAGYHVGALGWAVLVIAVVSAIPIFVTPKDLLYKISMLQVFLTLVGGVLVVSVLVRVGGHLGVGLIFCLAGFIVELAGSAVKLRSLAA